MEEGRSINFSKFFITSLFNSKLFAIFSPSLFRQEVFIQQSFQKVYLSVKEKAIITRIHSTNIPEHRIDIAILFDDSSFFTLSMKPQQPI